MQSRQRECRPLFDGLPCMDDVVALWLLAKHEPLAGAKHLLVLLWGLVSEKSGAAELALLGIELSHQIHSIHESSWDLSVALALETRHD